MHVLPHLSVCGRNFVIAKKEVQEHTQTFTKEENRLKFLRLLKLATRNSKVAKGEKLLCSINVTIISLFVIYLFIIDKD